MYSALFDHSWHVPVGFRQCKPARDVWINDSYRAGCGLDRDAAVAIASKFAVETVDPLPVNAMTEGMYADIYSSRFPIGPLGSGRCLTDGEWQAKGCGRTPLASDDLDENHRNGLLSLEEAIRETIWGEILHVVLPYGSVRSLSVGDYGGKIVWRRNDGNLEEGSAVLVRKAPFRIAHLLPFAFPARADRPELRAVNRKRLDTTYRLFADYLRSQNLSANDWWMELVERQMTQSVWAWVHHIGHGGLLSSNLTTDGAWLDFGSVSYLPDFRAYILVNGSRPSGREHALMFVSLADLRHELVRAGFAIECSEGDLRIELIKIGRRAFGEAIVTMLMPGRTVSALASLLADAGVRAEIRSLVNLMRWRNRELAGTVFDHRQLGSAGDSVFCGNLDRLAHASGVEPCDLQRSYAQHVGFMAEFFRPNFKYSIESDLSAGCSASDIIDRHLAKLATYVKEREQRL